jgi:excisionase family DNA binding protein
MNLKTAASRLSVHYQTAYKLVRSGSLAAVKIGGTYEISEAALDRYRAERERLRAAANEVRETVPTVDRDRDAAIADARAVAESTTTSALAAFESIAYVAGETVGDTCVVRARTERGFEPVACYDPDPHRRGALASVVQGFGLHGPIAGIDRVEASHNTLVVPHVAQDRLRASIDPQHRQFLDVCGVHSIVMSPVVLHGRVEAVVAISRATPGAPYKNEDVEFVDELAAALRLALARADAYKQGWERRRELVGAVRRAIVDGDEETKLPDALRDDRFAEVVYDLRDAMVVNRATAALTGGDGSALVNGFAHADASAAKDPLRAGELEFHDDERDIALGGGLTRRVVMHRGLVRDDAARPRALVIVAQPAPR